MISCVERTDLGFWSSFSKLGCMVTGRWVFYGYSPLGEKGSLMLLPAENKDKNKKIKQRRKRKVLKNKEEKEQRKREN